MASPVTAPARSTNFRSSTALSERTQTQVDSAQSELQLVGAIATISSGGVLLQWRTNSATDNVGFNIYRTRDGQRVRVNKEIIPGAVFAPDARAPFHTGHSYSWFDRGGTADSTYYIESISLAGAAKVHDAINPVVKASPGIEQSPEVLTAGTPNASESTDSFQRPFPAAETLIDPPNGPITDQWAIAAQSVLKIAIKKDGWYRVTQTQMSAVGFDPGSDVRNLRLFVAANEVAISTSQSSGPMASGDYIEFYGRGLDTPVTDSRIYYLVAGQTRGKRVRGEIQLDGDPTFPPAPPAPPPTAPPVRAAPMSTPGSLFRDPIFFSWALRDLSVLIDSLNTNGSPLKREVDQNESAPAPASAADVSRRVYYDPEAVQPPRAAVDSGPQRSAAPANSRSEQQAAASKANLPVVSSPGAVSTVKSLAVPASRAGKHRRPAGFRRKRGTARHKSGLEHNHAAATVSSGPANFDYAIETKNRLLYLGNLLNGDESNYFGHVISSPVTETITVPNPDLSAAGPAKLEFALQGVSGTFPVSHQVNVKFNGVTIADLNFGPLDHPSQTISIPLIQLHSGANTVTFTRTSSGDVSLVDFTRLTYPHLFQADNNSLKFNLRGTQSRKVDGFATPLVRLVDYSDPLDVIITKAATEPSALGYAVTVPSSGLADKAQRLLYALPIGQFDQPAAITLNQPSTLNFGSNFADLLIVSHKDFIAALEPLRVARTNQGLAVKLVDIEDIYDEFSYGVHGPQALRDFLQYAATHWTNNGTPTPPRYIVFAGDASLDPRNYEGYGNFDFVPTKLIDATYNETASDDWLADFDNDGTADIPVGRLAFRTTADVNLIVGKILNFTPANVPQAALLVADDPTGYYFNFEQSNDQVQALLPSTMTVQRVNVRTDGSSAARANIIAGFNQGRALVNYTGHGNVDVWSGSSIFSAKDDALALTNNNKLSFVVVMDCLNGYFQDPRLLSMSEALLLAQNGGAVAAFASSGLTLPDGQHAMSLQLYSLLYGSQPIALGDAIKIAKGATTDVDVRRTWIFFGDPSIRIR